MIQVNLQKETIMVNSTSPVRNGWTESLVSAIRFAPLPRQGSTNQGYEGTRLASVFVAGGWP